MKRTAPLLALLLLLWTGAACNDRAVPTALDALASIDSLAIEPASVALDEQSSVLLRAHAYAAGRRLEAEVPVSWATDVPNVASVTVAGRLKGEQPGVTRVSARHGALRATAFVWVRARPATAVDVAPTELALLTGQAAQIFAVARAEDGTVLSGRSVAWSSSSPDVAAVDTAGRVTARRRGVATITARAGMVHGAATVHVSWAPATSLAIACPDCTRPVAGGWLLARGDREALELEARDAAGNVVVPGQATWSSSAPDVVAVDGDGMARAMSAGEATMTVAADGQTASAVLRVDEPVRIVLLGVWPDPLTAGGLGTVTGMGFAGSVAANRLSIGGVVAEILTASASQMVFRVPALALDPEAGPQEMRLRVRAEADGEVRVGEQLVRVQGVGQDG